MESISPMDLDGICEKFEIKTFEKEFRYVDNRRRSDKTFGLCSGLDKDCSSNNFEAMKCTTIKCLNKRI